MKVGAVLRFLGLAIFTVGVLGGCVLGQYFQSLAFSQYASSSDFNWMIAIIVWVPSTITAALIYAIGAMSDNLDDMNAELFEIQNSTQDEVKALWQVLSVLNQRLPGATLPPASNGIEANNKSSSRRYMRFIDHPSESQPQSRQKSALSHKISE